MHAPCSCVAEQGDGCVKKFTVTKINACNQGCQATLDFRRGSAISRQLNWSGENFPDEFLYFVLVNMGNLLGGLTFRRQGIHQLGQAFGQQGVKQFSVNA